MFNKTKFRKNVTDFIINSLEICRENQNKLLIEDILIPRFFKNGKYDKPELIQKPNYEYFVNYIIKNDIENIVEYEILNFYFKESEIQKFNTRFDSGDSKNKSDTNIPLLDYTKKFPKKILIGYLEIKQNFDLDLNVLNKVLKSFFEFLSNVLEDKIIVPLFNFQSDIDEQGVSFGNFILRRINSEEFRIISKLDMHDNPKISSKFHNLTHVLIFINSNKPNIKNSEEIKTKIIEFVSGLKIHFQGNLQIGGIYKNIYSMWIKYSLDEEEDFIYRGKNLVLLKKDISPFKKFYMNLFKIDLTKKENEFFNMAIRRYISATVRQDVTDAIIDCIIALESLYSTGSGETTLKISNRVSTLLADNDDEREFYWNFIKESYKYRSGIVHGSGSRSVIINNMTFEPEEILNKLYKITQDSIKLYMKIISNLTGSRKNEKILDELDMGLINRRKLSIFKKQYLK